VLRYCSAEALRHAEIGLSHHPHASRSRARNVVGQRRFEIVALRTIVDGPSVRAQIVCKSTHCGKNEHELPLVVRLSRPLRKRLDHQHARRRAVESGERRIVRRTLITGNPDRRT